MVILFVLSGCRVSGATKRPHSSNVCVCNYLEKTGEEIHGIHFGVVHKDACLLGQVFQDIFQWFCYGLLFEYTHPRVLMSWWWLWWDIILVSESSNRTLTNVYKGWISWVRSSSSYCMVINYFDSPSFRVSSIHLHGRASMSCWMALVLIVPSPFHS